jgi:hypothetical protein
MPTTTFGRRRSRSASRRRSEALAAAGLARHRDEAGAVERDANGLEGRDRHRVPPRNERLRDPVAVHHLEERAVHVERVPELARVLDLPDLDVAEARLERLAERPRRAVDGHDRRVAIVQIRLEHDAAGREARRGESLERPNKVAGLHDRT